MKTRTLLSACAPGLLVLGLLNLAGCDRNRQDAIIIANEADKSVKVDANAAIQKYEEATRLDPKNHFIWNKLGQAYRKLENWPKMAEALNEASKVDGTWASYWADRGYALEMQARKKTISYEEAKAPYNKCIEVDTNYADCYHQLGNVYLWTDDEQKALEHYTKAIEHDPTQLRYYGPLADLYIRLGYVKEAEQVLKEAKSFAGGAAPDQKKLLVGIHVLAADVAQTKGDMNEQVKELEAAKAAAPDDSAEAVQILFSLGSTYAKLNPPRKQEAIEMLKGFHARACKGQKKELYKTECETTSTIVTKDLGGTLQ